MYALLLIFFVLVALLQTVVILLQSSKGGGLAGAFGGGGMNTAFGSRGTATFLSKLTTGFAVAFMVIALILGLMKPSGGPGRSVVSQEREARGSSPASIGVPVVAPESDNQGIETTVEPQESGESSNE